MDDPIGKKSLEAMSEAGWYNKLIFDRFIKPNLGSRVLEIGSGIGNFTKLLLKNSNFVVASDIRSDYLNFLKKKKAKGLIVSFGDIEKNIFKPKSNNFDSLICLNVLEHIKDDQRALLNMNKKLKKGGRLILLVPAHQEFFGTLDQNLGHYRRYNKFNLRKKLKKANFKVVSENYFNPISGIGWYVNGRILKKKSINRSIIKIFNFVVKPIINFEKYIEPPFGLSVVIVAVSVK